VIGVRVTSPGIRAKNRYAKEIHMADWAHIPGLMPAPALTLMTVETPQITKIMTVSLHLQCSFRPACRNRPTGREQARLSR